MFPNFHHAGSANLKIDTGPPTKGKGPEGGQRGQEGGRKGAGRGQEGP